MTTNTTEPLQPVRLYFDVHAKARVLEVFQGLECVMRDATRPGMWLWFYEGEAATIELPKRPDELPDEARPLVLAEMSLPAPRKMVMRFRSPHRAIAAMKFFGPVLGGAAVLERVRILNRLLDPRELALGLLGIDALLDRRVTVNDAVPEERLERALAGEAALAEKRAAVGRVLAETRNQDVPEVEELRVWQQSDRFAGLSLALRARALRAFQRWSGNEVTVGQIIERWVETWDETLAAAPAGPPG